MAVDAIQRAALPLHVQKLERAFSLGPLINQVEELFGGTPAQDDIRSELEVLKLQAAFSKQTVSNACLYNFKHVNEERKWVKDILLSTSDDSESELSESEQLQIMMELQYKRKKKWRKSLKRDPKLRKHKYFSAGLVSSHDHYPEHMRRLEEQWASGEGGRGTGEQEREEVERHQLNIQKEKERYRQRLWAFITKKEIPKMAKQFSTARHNTATNNKRLAQLCQREVRKVAQKSQRASKEVSVQPRAKRLTREAIIYWRRYERVEKEQRKRAEKEALEQRKIGDEMKEARRQQRKLNFLITQTELYAHFMAKKLTGEADVSDRILQQLEDGQLQQEVRPGVVVPLEDPGEYDSEAMKAQVLANVHSAFRKQEQTHLSYIELARQGRGGGGPEDKRREIEMAVGEGSIDLQESFDQRYSLATPTLTSDRELPQPTIFQGLLKVYQLKGMNWLANLYDQGINGILADEMGLGKTVQSIALLSHLAERQGIWGPFLIVAPASTLHNWQQECTRFVPRFKVLPYWGSPEERKIIRKYWNQKLLYKEEAPFHILITSYQLVVQDVRYFQRVKWQYMILDEAQAIKSSSSVRWKVLLSFNCRNRLLLTGTPIQNTMQELWALLHFIMPMMFDSHEEFNEWFSRDIESHAEKKSILDENQLSRLHMILKPFMLRRIKKDVEHEMAEKIEVHLSCRLSTRQQRLYHGLRQRISIEDLLQYSKAHANNSSKDPSSHLLNLVMQFRKVCNHPDLFERREVNSPVSVPVPSYFVPQLLYHEVARPSVGLHRLLTVTLGVHSTEHIHCSAVEDNERSAGCWSFLRLIDTSPQEAASVMLGSLASRMLIVLNFMERVHLLYQQRLWNSNFSQSRSSRAQLLLWPEFRASYPARRHSSVLQALVFTSHTATTYTHTTHRVFPLKTSAKTSAELTKISSTVSDISNEKQPGNHSPTAPSNPIPPTGSKIPLSVAPQALPNGLDHLPLPCHKGIESLQPLCQDSSTETADSVRTNDSSRNDFGASSNKTKSSESSKQGRSSLRELDAKSITHEEAPCSEHRCVPTNIPKFLLSHMPTVEVPLNPLYCSDRGAEFTRLQWLSGGPPVLKLLLYYGRLVRKVEKLPEIFYPSPPGGLEAAHPPTGWSHIHIPDKDNMIYDSGKMAVLDKLLAQLKREDHRVLIYSQMTRMIDLLEEFMAYRRYKYIRLDGSSRIADRRDMVDDFQTKSDIFVFLLSTRAGGLGINLTAADTVIFYDSDWNPTVDQQAMDRAHRLGQTKQVTVYRLIVKGTIEERILQRAREKSEIQRMVISGGDFKPDALKPKEMVSLLLDDEEMETRFLAKQAEKRALEQQLQGKKTKSKKRKIPPNGKEGEPLLKRPRNAASGTPSPLVFSRPDSVLSGSSEMMNGEDMVDVVGSNDGSEVASEISRPGSTPVRQRGSSIKTSAPLGGRGRMHRKRVGGAGSGSAAASAGALAGALAASSVAYAVYGISPSPNSSLAASPASNFQNAHGSTHSSPRASPVPPSFVASQSQTPPAPKTAKNYCKVSL